jgi:hypothetical protein
MNSIKFEGAWRRKDNTAIRLAWSLGKPSFGFKYVVVKVFLGKPQELPGARLKVKKSDVRWTVKFWGDNFARAKSQWSTTEPIVPDPELLADAMRKVLDARRASTTFLDGMALQAEELARLVADDRPLCRH